MEENEITYNTQTDYLETLFDMLTQYISEVLAKT